MNSDNNFPRFKKLELSDQKIVEDFALNYPPYSDFDFSSLWAYNTNSKTEITWLNKNLVIKHADYLTGSPVFSFLGHHKSRETISSLLDYLKQNGHPEELFILPEDSVKELLNIEDLDFLIEEDSDQHDYIISLKESAELKNINSHKLKAYNTFLNTNDNYDFKIIDLKDPQIVKQIFKVFDHWASKGNKLPEDSIIERTAIQRLIEISHLINLRPYGLYIEGELTGYLLDEYLHSTFVIGHFIKADTTYPGIYEFINQRSARDHYDKGYLYINIEQDLGIKGLRISKMQRNPVNFLKKYKVSRKLAH